MNEKETIDKTVELLDRLIDEKREQIRHMKEVICLDSQIGIF